MKGRERSKGIYVSGHCWPFWKLGVEKGEAEGIGEYGEAHREEHVQLKSTKMVSCRSVVFCVPAVHA